MNNWQLVVYPEDENDETTLPLAEYLSMRYEGRVGWNPSLEDSTIILESQGREWLASKWNLGNIGVMALQFEAARKRLGDGHLALIRSAVDDYSDVPFLMLEPINSAQILISLFFIDDIEMRLIFPDLDAPAKVKKLYDHVTANRLQLLDSTCSDHATYSFVRLPFPFQPLLNSLKHEAKLGRQLYEVLGEQMT